jgi:hypothetical protein
MRHELLRRRPWALVARRRGPCRVPVRRRRGRRAYAGGQQQGRLPPQGRRLPGPSACLEDVVSSPVRAYRPQRAPEGCVVGLRRRRACARAAAPWAALVPCSHACSIGWRHGHALRTPRAAGHLILRLPPCDCGAGVGASGVGRCNSAAPWRSSGEELQCQLWRWAQPEIGRGAAAAGARGARLAAASGRGACSFDQVEPCTRGRTKSRPCMRRVVGEYNDVR